ncbi:MAG: hypothetical protein ACTHU1_13290 [Arachnia sp.]
MTINPAIRAEAERLLDRLLPATTEDEALDQLVAANIEQLPVVAAAALCILASQTTEATPDDRSHP